MSSWQQIKHEKLSARDKLLETFVVGTVPGPEEVKDVSDFIEHSSLLTEKEQYITNLDIPQLLQDYSSGNLTVKEATKAYCKRAALAHQLTNCLTEIRFQEALEEAEQLDQKFSTTGLIGPLHGVIISVKDNINVAGLASSMGFVGLANDIKTDDSTFVTLLKSLGGIIIAKTNTSAGMIYSETTNVLWGRTMNPFNRNDLNVGGSSGGEGALALLKGSCFGIGSDIGGSVRHPAALNRVFSLKPSSGRFPKIGTVSGQEGQESIVSVYGVLTRSISNLSYSVNSIIEAKPYFSFDTTCIPLDLRPVKLLSKMVIGIMRSDGLNTVTPPLARALDLVKHKLQQQGHTVIEWDDTYFREIRSTIYPFYGADGQKHVKSILSKYNEPPDYHIENMLPEARDMNVSELWKSQKQRTDLTQKYFKLWQNGGGNGVRLDGIISASSPYPACLINKIVPQPLNSIWNALDYSAGTFPVTRCDKTIDKPDGREAFITDSDKEVYETYCNNLDKFHGGPVSLQAICRKLEEEKCVELIRYLSELIL